MPLRAILKQNGTIKLKNVIDVLMSFRTDAIFMFTSEGLRINVMDQSTGGTLLFKFDPSFFHIYKCDGDAFNIEITMSTFKKKIASCSPDDDIVFDMESDESPHFDLYRYNPSKNNIGHHKINNPSNNLGEMLKSDVFNSKLTVRVSTEELLSVCQQLKRQKIDKGIMIRTDGNKIIFSSKDNADGDTNVFIESLETKYNTDDTNSSFIKTEKNDSNELFQIEGVNDYEYFDRMIKKCQQFEEEADSDKYIRVFVLERYIDTLIKACILSTTVDILPIHEYMIMFRFNLDDLFSGYDINIPMKKKRKRISKKKAVEDSDDINESQDNFMSQSQAENNNFESSSIMKFIISHNDGD